jgi:hypothetical protein
LIRNTVLETAPKSQTPRAGFARARPGELVLGK